MAGLSFDFPNLLEGALQSLLWSAVGFAVWWVMFRAPLGRRTFLTSIVVNAPVERVWSACLLEPSPPDGWSGALEIAEQSFQGEPPERHRALARHGGSGPFKESVWRVKQLTPGVLYEGEQILMEGAPVEPGDAATVTLRLTPRDKSVLAEYQMRRLARGVFGHLYVPRANQRFLAHVRAECEGEEAGKHPAVVSRRATWLMAFLAFASIVLLFSGGNSELVGMAAFIGFFLQLAIWLHEYGHLAALRWFGHKEASFVIVPLLGGAAINARGAKTRFEDAMVALMGPALSGAVVLLLTPLVSWGLRFFDAGWDAVAFDWSRPETIRTWAGLCVIAFLAMAIPINLYNLVPLGLLDGGRVVSALARGRLSEAFLTSSIFAALAYAFAGSAGPRDLGAALAFVAVVWVVGEFTSNEAKDPLPPMNARECFATAALLVVTLTIYVEASRTLTPMVLSALKAGLDGGVVQTQGPTDAS
jgi:Zn-dependent protease